MSITFTIGKYIQIHEKRVIDFYNDTIAILEKCTYKDNTQIMMYLDYLKRSKQILKDYHKTLQNSSQLTNVNFNNNSSDPRIDIDENSDSYASLETANASTSGCGNKSLAKAEHEYRKKNKTLSSIKSSIKSILPLGMKNTKSNTNPSCQKCSNISWKTDQTTQTDGYCDKEGCVAEDLAATVPNNSSEDNADVSILDVVDEEEIDTCSLSFSKSQNTFFDKDTCADISTPILEPEMKGVGLDKSQCVTSKMTECHSYLTQYSVETPGHNKTLLHDLEINEVHTSPDLLNTEEEYIVEEDSNTFPIDQSSVNFILFGPSGNGKSATGNSILGRDCFKSNSRITTEFERIDRQSSNNEGLTVTVVDMPGLDAVIEKNEMCTFVSDNMNEAFNLCNNYFNSILIVLNLESRYTDQQKSSVKLLKGLFGEKVIANCGICIITHGDTFDLSDKDENAFLEWCKSQEGTIQTLFEECEYRCVLFDNKTKNKAVLKHQLDILLKYRDGLTAYTKKDYDINHIKREQFREIMNMPEKNKLIMNEIDLIREKFKHVANIDIVGDELNIFISLMKEIETLEQKLSDSDQTLKSVATVLKQEIASRWKNVSNSGTKVFSEKL